jgi:hypothetical protein
MGKVPITVMGFKCERCSHEWIPKDINREPTVCPQCKSPYWNRPKKASPVLTYEIFREKILFALKTQGDLSWTEVRTSAQLPQMFPNNKWVHRLEHDIKLHREKNTQGIIIWRLDE